MHEKESNNQCSVKQNNCYMVRFQKGIVNDVVNIRSVKPFHEQKAITQMQQTLNQPSP
jgi:hypothetical protein